MVRFSQGVGVGAAVALAIAACGISGSVGPDTPAPGAPAQITVTFEGGIAALRVRMVVDSASRVAVRETCSLGVAENMCGAAGTRVTVTASAAAISRLFGLTQTAAFRALKADYGQSTQGADLMVSRTTIVARERSRSIIADDITAPNELRAFHGEVSALFP